MQRWRIRWDSEILGLLESWCCLNLLENVGLGPHGSVLPMGLWGAAMFDLLGFKEPPTASQRPEPPPIVSLGPSDRFVGIT